MASLSCYEVKWSRDATVRFSVENNKAKLCIDTVNGYLYEKTLNESELEEMKYMVSFALRRMKRNKATKEAKK